MDRELAAYGRSNAYPFHMPGHKRQLDGLNPYAVDITEIAGFDNLHHASGLIAEAQERAARLYGADYSYFLVNGSTCGILAAISDAVPRGGRVLMARNCHKSVYHALALREATIDYVYPAPTRTGIQGQIPVAAVEAALKSAPLEKTTDIQQKDIQHQSVDAEKLNLEKNDADLYQKEQKEQLPYSVVIVTSPTYEGVVSDIEGIARTAHAHGIPLIVDAAHGAHLGFTEAFPPSSLACGADAVITSVHKTLPSLTQTALLHLKGTRISPQRVEEYLDIYETSSPSYVLMASIDRCIHLMEAEGTARLQQLAQNLETFHKRMAGLQHLHLLRKEELTADEAYDFDPSKLLIFTTGTGMTGVQLADRLRREYDLELEMACGIFALALTSLMDTPEAFRRLGDALLAIDAEIDQDMVGHPEFNANISCVQSDLPDTDRV